ncbi:MAG: hypothetical protein D6772_13140 [Bacteroidetes bacterium]|nr:MAG: hypothetical protein D6772_13140 [Bacteroidota bacterium]
MIIETEVTRIDSFRIEVEEDNAELLEILENYKEYITEVDDLKEFIEHLSIQIAFHGLGRFYEGFGHVKTFRGDYEHYQPLEAEMLPGVVVYLQMEEEFEVESNIIAEQELDEAEEP